MTGTGGTVEWAERAAEVLDEFGVVGRLRPLSGENHNFVVEHEGGVPFVLKIVEGAEPHCGFERAVVEHLYAAGIDLELPRSVQSLAGQYDVGVVTDLERGAPESAWAQLLAFVDGKSWKAAPRNANQRRELGEWLGKVACLLEGFDHPDARRTHRWDLARAGQHRSKVALVSPGERRVWLDTLFHRWAAAARPGWSALPHGVIHGDANDENVLVRGGRVSGLIDFGDALWNPLICELAIAMAYAMQATPDPLRAGADIVEGYHSSRRLAEKELAVLYPLVCGRLAVTVATAAERRRIDPDHPTWFASEEPAWELIERLIPIDPEQAVQAWTRGLGVPTPGGAGGSNAGAQGLDHLLERRRVRIGPSLSLSYDEPLEIVRGYGQYLFDRRGRPFLDMVNNVCHVGHCHPHVVEAGQRQMAQLNTNTRYVYGGLTQYADRLTALLPQPLSVCYFVNSGSEANELALRLARAHTGRRDLLVVDGAYHGHTNTLIDISPYKFMGRGGRGRAEDWVHIVPMPDGYRGAFKGNGRATGEAYALEVQRAIDAAERPVGGFIAESILSCGGQVVAPEGYFERAYEHVRAAGGVCIADEVQVGFGRVGSHFWGFELGGVVPDVVVMGKPIGNGHPMAAVVTTPEIAASFANGMEFFCTFGGNPVSCAIGSAVLDVIENECLQERARRLGGKLRAGLADLQERHELIGDVRGEGLFLGIELVRSRDTLEPADTEAAELVERMKSRGVLLSTDGPLHNAIKMKPPMVLDEDDVDMVLRHLDDELGQLRP